MKLVYFVGIFLFGGKFSFLLGLRRGADGETLR